MSKSKKGCGMVVLCGLGAAVLGAGGLAAVAVNAAGGMKYIQAFDAKEYAQYVSAGAVDEYNEIVTERISAHEETLSIIENDMKDIEPETIVVTDEKSAELKQYWEIVKLIKQKYNKTIERMELIDSDDHVYTSEIRKVNGFSVDDYDYLYVDVDVVRKTSVNGKEFLTMQKGNIILPKLDNVQNITLDDLFAHLQSMEDMALELNNNYFVNNRISNHEFVDFFVENYATKNLQQLKDLADQGYKISVIESKPYILGGVGMRSFVAKLKAEKDGESKWVYIEYFVDSADLEQTKADILANKKGLNFLNRSVLVSSPIGEKWAEITEENGYFMDAKTISRDKVSGGELRITDSGEAIFTF